MASVQSPRKNSHVFRRILVVVHGTDAAQLAVRRAVSCAGRIAELALLDVVHEPILDGYMGNTEIYKPLCERVVAERNDNLHKLAVVLRERGMNVVCNAVWDHPFDEAVGRHARTVGADLVVFAPHDVQRSGLSHSDWRLITTCPVPVLVVKAPATQPYRHIVAAVDPFRDHAKPAELDLEILGHARELQAQTGATLRAVHCFTPLEHLSPDLHKHASSTSGAELRREEVERLMRAADLQPSLVQLEIGRPHEVVKRLAERGDADVIVMGALARGRVKEWLIGSTAERVLHSGGVDVLAVKPGAGS
jgi:universal stress protein E